MAKRMIRMLKSDKRLGFKKGEVYEVEPYWLDPSCKLSAIRKVLGKGKYGVDSGFNVYRESRGEEWEYVKEDK